MIRDGGFDEQIHSRESFLSERGLGYTAELKQLLAEHPQLMRAFYAFQKQLKNAGPQVKRGVSLREPVVYVDHSVTITELNNHYAKVEIDAGSNSISLFVKSRAHHEPGFKEGRDEILGRHIGFNEFHSSLKAKEKLKDVPGVRTVESVLGYSSKENDYFVSKYEAGLESLGDLLAFKESNEYRISDDKHKDLDSRVNIILKRLRGYTDLDPWDMLYDPVKDEIVVTDLVEDDLEA